MTSTWYGRLPLLGIYGLLNSILWAGPLPAQAAELQIRQTVRQVELDPETKVHLIDIFALPNLTTTIRLPDSFAAQNISCGQCIDLSQPGAQAAGPANAARDPRNWIIEKNMEQRSIHIRPAKLPSADNPITAFDSNLFVSLDGGHAIHMSLHLLRLPRRAPATPLEADAVINLHLPAGESLAGKLAEEQTHLRERFAAEVQESSAKQLAQRLLGTVQCRTLHWSRPRRTDKTVLRIHQLCMTKEAPRTFWVHFDVENRASSELQIDRVELIPNAPVQAQHDPSGYYVANPSVGFGEHRSGVALLTLQADSPIPSTWRLRLIPASTDRHTADVDGLVF
jgi:hypothetical protein